MMRTIMDVLRDEDCMARVSCADKWLVYDNESLEWVVYTRPAYAKTTKELYRGSSEADAVEHLTS